MNSLRIRIVLLGPLNNNNPEFNHAVQLSQDGLMWWTFYRFKSMDEALGAVKTFEEFTKQNQLVKPSHILWATKV